MALSQQMNAGIGNELGHFEDFDFVRLHAHSINRQVRRSWGWKVRSARTLQFDQQEDRIATELISNRQKVDVPWSWKDPRTILFANEWKSRIPQLQTLVIWRSGASVIDSLVARSYTKNRWQGVKIGYIESSLVDRAYKKLMLKYVERHSQEVIGCPIEDLVQSDGRKLLCKIESRCKFNLNHVSFQDLFKTPLMNQKKPSIKSRFLYAFLRGRKIDDQFRKLFPPLG